MITGTPVLQPGQAATLIFGPLGGTTTVILTPISGAVLLATSANATPAQSFTLAETTWHPGIPVTVQFAEGDSLYATAVASGGQFTYIGYPAS